MKKMFAKFGGLLASLALVAALVFTLFGCSSPEKLIEKLTAEDANYTVEMKMNFGGKTQIFTMRVVGKEFYSKTTDGTETEYSGLIQDSGKYYMIGGDDETLVKEEITEALFNDYAEEEIGKTKGSIESLKSFKKYFIKGEDGKYKIDPDQLLAYYNDFLPEAQKVTEVPAETKASLESSRIEFDGGKITISSTISDAIILTFSEIGSTNLTPFTDKTPTVE